MAGLRAGKAVVPVMVIAVQLVTVATHRETATTTAKTGKTPATTTASTALDMTSTEASVIIYFYLTP